jgi:hypothetical protein
MRFLLGVLLGYSMRGKKKPCSLARILDVICVSFGQLGQYRTL